MPTRSESLKKRWGDVPPEERSKIMSARRKAGALRQTPEYRSELAKKAVEARWAKNKKTNQ